MTGAPLLLGIDLGTTAVKAGLYGVDGGRAAEASQECTLLSSAGGAVELDADEYWRAMVRSVHGLLRDASVTPGRITALALSCQGETLLPIGSDDRPLRNAIVWLDNRAVEESGQLADRFEQRDFYAATGQPEMLPTWPAAKLLWLSRHEPEVFHRARRLALLEDYVLLRLTGEFVSEGSLLTSTCYWDFRKKMWWTEMLDALGVEEDTLPIIVEPGSRVGTLRPSAADELGLTVATVVCAGALDQACGAIGVGNTSPGRLSESTGAAVALCATLESAALDPAGRIPCHYHGIADTYMFHTFTTGGVVLRWFRDQLCESETAVAALLNRDSYEILSCEAATVAPGCDGLFAIPHFQGAMAPESNSAARGAFIGLTLAHTRAHLTRAIMESVVYVIRRTIEVFREIGCDPVGIWSLGGGARSPVWKQIEADVLQLPVMVTDNENATTLGAAILAGVADGRFTHVDEAAAKMSRVKAVFDPNPETAAVYEDSYERYRDAYTALCPVFDRAMGKNL